MADASNRSETQHHLLIDVEDRDQQHQRPEQRRAVVLTCLGICAEGAGVIVADHHDETGPEDGEQGLQPCVQVRPRRNIVFRNRAEGAVDVAEMGAIQHRRMD
jgi:hypothetical protein